MNNVLDSRLEALAVNYISFGFLNAVNSIWTWVAVIAGAVSFLFTIRKPAKSITGPVLSDPLIRNVVPAMSANTSIDSCPDTLQISSEKKSSTEQGAIIRALVQQIQSTEGVVGTTKGKFMAYYEDDVTDVKEDNKVNECHVVERECRGWEWEKMLRTRILSGEEMGWYRYQNITSIDGNVVRLWDGCRRVNTSSNFVSATYLRGSF